MCQMPLGRVPRSGPPARPPGIIPPALGTAAAGRETRPADLPACAWPPPPL